MLLTGGTNTAFSIGVAEGAITVLCKALGYSVLFGLCFTHLCNEGVVLLVLILDFHTGHSCKPSASQRKPCGFFRALSLERRHKPSNVPVGSANS